MGDVVALDAAGQAGQVEGDADLQEGLAALAFAVEPGRALQVQGFGGIAGGHLDEAALGTALGAANGDVGAAERLQPGLEHIHVGEIVRDEDKLGDFGGAVVVLPDEAVQHFGFGLFAGDGQVVVMVADELAAADAEDGGNGIAVLADGGDYVDLALAGVGVRDLLFSNHLFHGRDAVAEPGSFLKVLGVGSCPHLFSEALLDVLVLTAQEADGAVDDIPILVDGDVAGAGGVAEADVVFEAGTGNWLGHADVARPVRKQPVEQLEGLAQGLGAGVGAEVERAVLGNDPGGGDAGIGLLHGDLEVEELLIVAVGDVEAGAVFLDEVVFEDQRLDFRVRNDDVEVGDAGDQRAGLVGVVAAPKVAADAAAQGAGLADVEHAVVRGAHEVDAGGVRQFGQLAFDGGTDGFASHFVCAATRCAVRRVSQF